MAKAKKNNEQFIITIDPYEHEGFKFGSNGAEILDISKSAQKQNLFMSYIKLKDALSATISIPAETNEDDITNTVSLKAYEEMSLDATVDYKITYFEAQAQGSDRLFNVFAIDNKIIENLFKNIVTKIPYIDYITISPFLYQALYEKGTLNGTDTDCFICFQKDDAFLAIYSNGTFFTTRPLRFNLTYIKDKFCEQTGDRISDETFFNLLRTKGLEERTQDSESSSNELVSIFEDLFLNISDMINVINRIYSIKINNVYIDSQIGNILNLDTFSQQQLDIKTHFLKTSVAINAKEFNISNQHNLLALMSRYYKENIESNFSMFLRPPDFAKRQSGKFILTCVGAAILGFAYPGYNYGAGYVLQLDSSRLNSELTDLNRDVIQIKAKLGQIEQEKKRIQELTQQEEEKLKFRENLLAEIETKKSGYIMKGKNLFDLTNILNSNGVQVLNIRNSDNNITFQIVADNDKRITNLIKDITQMQKYLVDTKKIHFEKSQGYYESNITIEIKQ